MFTLIVLSWVLFEAIPSRWIKNTSHRQTEEAYFHNKKKSGIESAIFSTIFIICAETLLSIFSYIYGFWSRAPLTVSL